MILSAQNILELKPSYIDRHSQVQFVLLRDG